MRRANVVLLCLLAALGHAQTREFVGGRLKGMPTLDGRVDDEEYKDAVRFEGLVDSATGAAAAEGGTFYLGFDDRFVYFAAKLADRQPGAIQATEFRTNVSLDGNDTVSLSLDPFGTLNDFNSFTMNARGATNIEIAGGRAAKREWLGDFAAKGRVTPEGWEVEARIPWSVMRLPGKGPHDLRFNVGRNHRRLQRYYNWAFTSNGLVQNAGRWKAVEMPAAPAPALQALPYVYGGLDEKTGIVANAGVDLRYGLTRDLDLVGTVNPDLRNIERSILSLDFSYFERLADENRPFFLEGQQYFGAWDNSGIFASQRIGNFDAGLKMFGKVGPNNNVGILTTGDFGKDEAVVARVNHQVDARTDWTAHNAGGAVDGISNDAFAASYGHGVGKWYFNGLFAGTQDEKSGSGYRASGSASFEQGRAFVFARYTEVTKDFLPRLGFAPQTNYRGVNVYAQQYVNLQKRGIIDYGIETSLAYQRSYDLKDPFHERAGLFPNITFKDGTHIGGGVSWDRYFGGSSDQTYGFSIDRPAGDPYRHWSVGYESGTRAYGPYRNLGANFAYRPLNVFQISGTYQKTTYLGDTFDQTILTANYDLDQYHSVGGRAVVSPMGTNWYVSFRQAGNRGAEYYLILGDPNAAHFRTSLILKAVFPVSVRL